MRKALFLLATILIAKINLSAQENLTFSKVINADSVGKEVIFSNINEWFATTYNSAKDIIQMTDKDAGILIGNGSIDYSFGKMSYMAYDGDIQYTIKVYVKDNRFKVELSNFIHRVKPDLYDKNSLGMITTSEFFTTTGLSKNYLNNVWEDIKIKMEYFSNGIFLSLENKTKSMNEKSDW